MKWIFSILVLFSLVSCDPMMFYDMEQDIPMSFETVEEAWAWVSFNIDYVADAKEEWQTPVETFERRAGDCEDIAILLLHFIKDLDPTARFVAVKMNGSGHALLRWKEVYIEPQIYPWIIHPSRFTVLYTMTYREALGAAHVRSIK